MPAAQHLTTMTALAQALSHGADLTQSLDAALATVAELLGLETGWVWLLEEGSEEPRLAAARALPPELRDHPDALNGDCYCLSTFRDGDLRGAANVNVVRCSRLARAWCFVPFSCRGRELRCHASVPLAVGERRLGMLNVASGDWRVLSADELNLLTTAGALVSLAIERTRLEAEGARMRAAEERNQLARDIHDTLAQSLAALTLQLEVADTQAAGGDPALGASVTRALDLARATLDDARRSVLDLREAPVDGRNLGAAIRRLGETVRAAAADRFDVVVTCEGLGDAPDELPTAVAVGLFRIAQQALANAAAHASPRRVAVLLARRADGVLLRVEDDGVGFDPAGVGERRFGIVGMNERARLLGGTLCLDSSPGGGTVIEVRAPIRSRGREEALR